jgi:hypothetical protein
MRSRGEVSHYWKPADESVNEKLSILMSLWEEAKGWGFSPNRNFTKRFWRVCDHHDWEHILQVITEWIDEAKTPLYLLKVLETPERFTQIEINAEVERCRERHTKQDTHTTDPDLNPFLSGSIERRSNGLTKLGDAVSNLPSTRDGSTT